MTIDDRAKWDTKYLQARFAEDRPAALFLEDNIDLLEACVPTAARTLDLAAGDGRNSLFLASHGFKVDAVDFSLQGLRRTRQKAIDKSLKVHTIVADLDCYTVPSNYYDLIINFFFLQRNLFDTMARGLKPGGLLLFETYTTAYQKMSPKRNMRRSFLLEPGELEHAFPMLEVLTYDEQGKTARLLARQRA